MYSIFFLNRTNSRDHSEQTVACLLNLPAPSRPVCQEKGFMTSLVGCRLWGRTISIKMFQFVVIHSQRFQHNETEVGVLKFTCFFYDPLVVGNLISGSSPFSKSSLNTHEYAFLTSFQVILMLLVQEPHFENHCTILYSEIKQQATKKFKYMEYLNNTLICFQIQRTLKQQSTHSFQVHTGYLLK